ncbi:hypothetical protein RD792_000197 [Penstemon davidsonii]|uniref:Exostosin GT47 domain-containing protein n=1 Tax=Penstemon davidsonii TaxID=160366 RepID=A0ABR0DUK2_9LAMI|nr:hypothetical protein RD792_000197 [Penstemon davidsonii]
MYTLFPSIKLQISSQKCAFLASTILLYILIFLFLNRPTPPRPLPSTRFEFPDDCEFGKVYVYDLPPILNKELLQSCNNSAEFWSSRCNDLSNGGFGPHATGLELIVPQNLTPAWYWTDLYAGEVIYHKRILNYKCRTLNQDQATAFYIPFYVGLSIGKYLWLNHTANDIDSHSLMMLKWVKNQDPWKRQNGSDHFIMLGRLTWDFRRITPDSDNEWGTSLLNMPLMKNVLRLTPERNVWDELEISVPYPNPFHPRSVSDIRQWQSVLRSKNRSSLFCFVGGARKYIKHDFRNLVLTYCKNESDSCRVVDCSVFPCYEGANATIETFLDSDFCLQPKGDGFTRRATFDCMLAGAIPVFFWKGSFENQYQWHLPTNSESYSVFIDNKDVRNDSTIIRRVLEKYNRDEVKKMRETIIDFMPKFLIAASDSNLGSIKDAFDIAMDGVLRKFKQQNEDAFKKN